MASGKGGRGEREGAVSTIGGAAKSRVVISRGGEIGEVYKVKVEWMQRAGSRLQIICWAFFVLGRASCSTLVGVWEVSP